MFLQQTLNRQLDHLVRPEIHLFWRAWASFQLCGLAGLLLAVVLAMTLIAARGLSFLMMGGIAVTSVAILFGLTMLTKIITGQERIINYHHQIAVLFSAVLFLHIMGQPVLAYLDATMLGVGLFIAWGRVGCLMMGCCHGRPHPWGVCYGIKHAQAGLTPYYVHIRLFPIQAVESLWLFATVIAGSTLVLMGYAPGIALGLYIVCYACGRFFFEFLRGDPERPYLWGFSEPQWTSLFVLLAVTWAEYQGILPYYAWHGMVLALLILTMSVLIWHQIRQPIGSYQLKQPRHIQEVATALAHVHQNTLVQNDTEELGPFSPPVEVGRTSLGMQISFGRVQDTSVPSYHYALSQTDRPLQPETAAWLADQIVQLVYPTLYAAPQTRKLLPGNEGVFHLIVHPPVVDHATDAHSPKVMAMNNISLEPQPIPATNGTELRFQSAPFRLLNGAAYFNGNCEECRPYCGAVCCTGYGFVPLTEEEIRSGKYAYKESTEECNCHICIRMRQSDVQYTLLKQPNGACMYLDGTGRCSIYEHRPVACKNYRCVNVGFALRPV